MFTSSVSRIAFAAADTGAGAKAPEPATESTKVPEPESTEAVEPAPAVNSQIVAVTDETKVASISKALKHQRTVFATFAEAYAVLTKAAEETESFFGLPIAVVGYDSETDTVDESIYADTQAVLSYVGARVKDGKGKIQSGIKAVVIFPLPTVDSFLAGGDAAIAFIKKIVEKEAAHVAFRNFRDAATVTELMNGASAAPKSVDDYVTASTREGDGLDTDTFDALWVSLRNALKAEQPALHKLLPGKPEIIKGIRSKAYAESEPLLAPLEAVNIFIKLAKALINGAANNTNKDGTPAPLDASAIQGWVDGRDTLVITKREAEAKDFSVLGELAGWGA